MTNTINGTYGSGQTECDVFTMEADGGHWYAVEGSQNVNFTYDDFGDGVDVERLSDSDTFTWPDGIHSESGLEQAVAG